MMTNYTFKKSDFKYFSNQIVFNQNNYRNDWYGLNNNGEPLLDGTYFVIVKARYINRIFNSCTSPARFQFWAFSKRTIVDLLIFNRLSSLIVSGPFSCEPSLI